MTKINLSRRLLVGASLSVSLGLLLYVTDDTKDGLKLYSNKVQVLLHCTYHLFPSSRLGPGAKEVNIAAYLSFVLKDERIMKEDREHFLQGAAWLEESAFEMYDKSFLNLTKTQKEKLMQSISTLRWGENFIYTSLGYIFEALLSTPAYGSNTNEMGWRWLEHNPGFPQPISKKEIDYAV